MQFLSKPQRPFLLGSRWAEFLRGVLIMEKQIAGLEERLAIEIQIRETITALVHNGARAMLYAYSNNEQIAALDFTSIRGAVCINMIFVKPQFRRRGIGSALARHLIGQYPSAKFACSDPAGHGRFLVRAFQLD